MNKRDQLRGQRFEGHVVTSLMLFSQLLLAPGSWCRSRNIDYIIISWKKTRKGENDRGTGWRRDTTKGKKRVFVGTLLSTHNYGKTRIAVFSVPK